MTEKICYVSRLGLVDFESACRLQLETAERRREDEIDDTLFLLRHPPVYTLGKRGKRENILLSDEELYHKGVKVARTDRGGDATFHGPGQMVAYPIIKLAGHYGGARSYVGLLERVIIDTLGAFGLSTGTDPEYPGVWIGEKKIASVGVRISRGVTRHGISINVLPEREFFSNVVPCGIKGRGVTSLAQCLGETPKVAELEEEFPARFCRVFGLRPVSESSAFALSVISQ